MEYAGPQGMLEAVLSSSRSSALFVRHPFVELEVAP